MSDLFGNHIVGFLMMRLNMFPSVSSLGVELSVVPSLEEDFLCQL